MAAGSVYALLESIGNGSSQTIRPASGSEAVVHNLFYAGNVEVYATDGTNSILIAKDSTADAAGGGSMLGLFLHVTNAHWLTVKNVAASGSKVIGYNGVVTA